MAHRLDSGCLIGGSIRLREIITEHQAAAAYDFRNRFGLSIFEIGHSVSLPEAVLLTHILLQDPSSWLTSSRFDWKYPVSREWIVSAHTWDLLAKVNSGKKKPKPYPNPFPDPNSQRVGRTRMTNEDVKKVLASMNPRGE